MFVNAGIDQNWNVALITCTYIRHQCNLVDILGFDDCPVRYSFSFYEHLSPCSTPGALNETPDWSRLVNCLACVILYGCITAFKRHMCSPPVSIVRENSDTSSVCSARSIVYCMCLLNTNVIDKLDGRPFINGIHSCPNWSKRATKSWIASALSNHVKGWPMLI